MVASYYNYWAINIIYVDISTNSIFIIICYHFIYNLFMGLSINNLWKSVDRNNLGIAIFVIVSTTLINFTFGHLKSRIKYILERGQNMLGL